MHRNEPPTEDSSEPLTTTVLSVLIGSIAAERFPVVAKVFLYFWKSHFSATGGVATQADIAEASLVVVFVFSFVGIGLGAILARRGWVTDKQVMLSVFTMIVVALFAILDHSIPDPSDGTTMSFGRTVYSLGWPTALYLLAPLLLLRRRDNSTMSAIIRLIAVSALMAVFCWVSGTIIIRGAAAIHDLFRIMNTAEARLSDRHNFWILSPSSASPIAGACVVIVYAPLWWSQLWAEKGNFYRGIWIVICSLFVVSYAGLYGAIFYDDEWFTTLVESRLASTSQLFFAFGAYALAALTAVLLSAFCAMTRSAPVTDDTCWSANNAFWLCLPVFFGIGFAVTILLFIVPLLRLAGVTLAQMAFFVIAHFVHGIVLGFTMRLFTRVTKWIRPISGSPIGRSEVGAKT